MERRLAAILAADVVDYCRLMECRKEDRERQDQSRHREPCAAAS
jgi:class 3 adenylate cyclase